MSAQSVPSAGPTRPALSPLVLLRGLAGAFVGGIAGYYLFRWLASQGLYGIIIPGALVGVAAGLAAQGRSLALGILCALFALPLTIVAEWSAFPFVADDSLAFFVRHMHELRSIKLAMMGLGVACAFWFGQGR